MNEANTQAYGTDCDNLSNTGTVVLDFENGELYLTLVGNADHAWDISMQHEHCSRGQTDAPARLRMVSRNPLNSASMMKRNLPACCKDRSSIAKIGEAMSICCSIPWQTAMTILAVLCRHL